jgi:hypothetical protein
MAQISTYPLLTPQFGDSVLGSNVVDTTGSPVIGNPTVQYTFSTIKTLVDQQYVQQFSQGSTAVSQGPGGTNTAHQIEFGALNNSSPNAQLAVNGIVTFVTTGTYQVELVYYLGNIPDANTVVALFRTLQGTDQLGATTLEQFTSNSNTARKRVAITYTVNITDINTTHTYQMFRDANGANQGLLVQTAVNNGTSPIASAQITISKLI